MPWGAAPTLRRLCLNITTSSRRCRSSSPATRITSSRRQPAIAYLEALQGNAAGVEGSGARCREAIAVHEGLLAERLLAYLRSRQDADIVGGGDSLAADRLPIVSFRLAGWDAGVVAQAVEAAQVAVRYGTTPDA